MAPHSSTRAWKIPWMEEPGRLQSMGSLRVGHGSATSLLLSLFNMRPGEEFSSVSSVAQSCPTLCDPMNHSTPGLPVHHQIPEPTQTHVHRVGDAIQPSHPLSSPCPAPNPSQSIGVSALASALPMKTQDWSPLGWTGWISLQSKGLLRVFSNTTGQSINSLALSFLHSPTLTSIHDYWKNHSLD